MKARVALVAFAVAALVGAGCGGSKTSTGEHATSHSSEQPARPVLVVDVTIRDGTVTPTNADLAASVGKPIELRVTSDAQDELHVHSVPEHTFAVAAKPDQVFTFTVDVPGRVDVELHNLNRTVATIQVRSDG